MYVKLLKHIGVEVQVLQAYEPFGDYLRQMVVACVYRLERLASCKSELLKAVAHAVEVFEIDGVRDVEFRHLVLCHIEALQERHVAEVKI